MNEIPEDESSRDLTLEGHEGFEIRHRAERREIKKCYLSRESMVETLAILPILLKKSSKLMPPIQLILFSTRIDPSTAAVTVNSCPVATSSRRFVRD